MEASGFESFGLWEFRVQALGNWVPAWLQGLPIVSIVVPVLA